MKEYTVGEFTKAVKNLIESSFRDSIIVSGEISNFSKSSSGHIYFTLKDFVGQLRAVYFKRYMMGSNIFIPKNGDKVKVIGNIVLYEIDGSYQLVVKKILYNSVGYYWQLFEEVKRKLEAQGLFDNNRKRIIPSLPKKIALLTSTTGAAIKDFLVTLQSMDIKINIEIWNIPVQSIENVNKVTKTIKLASSMYERYDLLILMRGGGSLEDLSLFNEESIATVLSASLIPTITAIGHERDFTIVDFVSDYRAATPTAAAHKVAIGYKNSLELLNNISEKIIYRVINRLQKYYQDIDYLELKIKKLSPNIKINNYANKLILIEKELKYYLTMNINSKKEAIKYYKKILKMNTPINIVNKIRDRLYKLDNKLKREVLNTTKKYQTILNQLDLKLKLLNPSSILDRGYALVLKDEKVVTNLLEVEEKENIEIKMKSGYIKSFVTGIYLEEVNGKNTYNA